MMIKLLYKLPRKVTVAFSGGVDSVAIVDFLEKNHDVSCAFFHHNTPNSERALQFVDKFCDDRDITLFVGYLFNDKPKHKSLEEHWRDERYKFLNKFDDVVTGHHLNDCIETYLWSAMHGEPKIIPNRRKNVLRPFLLNPKQEFIDWCVRKDLEWCEDLSNEDDKYMRNYIRKHVVPHAYHVNPGIEKVVRRMILDASKPK
jgi:tRNA(Ile)-lysidine synthase